MNYTEEQKQFIRDNYLGISSAELAERFNKEFGTDRTAAQLRSWKKGKCLSSGYDARFQKGHTSHNKGKHVKYAGSEKGWYKKGNHPHNTVPVGTLSYTSHDRYVVRKIAEPNVWEFEHKLVWVRHHGHIPAGMMIIFLDGDKNNLDINNLALVTKRENQALNRKRLRFDDTEATRTALTLVKLQIAIQDKKGAQKNETT